MPPLIRLASLVLPIILLTPLTSAGEDIFAGSLETIWEEGGFTEGAAVAPNGDIYFSDFAQPFNARPARIMRFHQKDGEVTVHCADSKMANGLMFNRKGVLYACCASPLGGQRALVIITPDGKVKPVVERYKGKRFNSPNDIVIDRQGRIYFSDPKYVGPEKMELASMDLYRLDPDGSLQVATSEIDKPNGVMLSPDGKTLYVAETDNGTDKADIVSDAKQGRMTLNAFKVNEKGELSNKRVLVNFGDQVGIDGMTVDQKGRIFAAVRSAKRFGIYVFSPEGKELDYVKTPELPTNCCFGVGFQRSTLYVTAGKGFYRISTNARGHHSAVAGLPVIESKAIQKALATSVIDANLPQRQVEEFCDARVARMPEIESLEHWERRADELRKRVLSRVVFRGEAAKWREHPLKVEWLEEMAGGEGYTITKLRYEALPGLWIPALLYRPDNLTGRAPAVMNVNGHDRAGGKAAKYKQLRCINQAKRGIIALNVEWLGMGQLHAPGYRHYRMNQLDLCGTSGLAPFYLSMERGLDVLFSLENTDPDRVAVAGLSGGGWQTIIISALDTRVKLSNPVAGYSSFRTRIANHSDLGDSEQTPCDLARFADYTHLTAMLAPRASLLTFNVKDNCCFASPHALPPLLAAARPVYELYKAEGQLAFHVNEDPGTHNFEQDNREALYRALHRHFFPDDDKFNAEEIPSEKELKSKEQLEVEIPEDNATFQSLAEELSSSLPDRSKHPKNPVSAKIWVSRGRGELNEIVNFSRLRCEAKLKEKTRTGGVAVTHWELALYDAAARRNPHTPVWTIPATEIAPFRATETVLVVGDAGRAKMAAEIERHLKKRRRVVAIDPFYFGESKIRSRDFLFGLLVSSVGERPIGIQSGQIVAVSRWLKTRNRQQPIALAAHGPRTSVMALAAAAQDRHDSIGPVELYDSLGTLKEAIEREWDAQKTPELFCFGLLAKFDVADLAALAAPRKVRFHNATDRVKEELRSPS